MALICPVRLQSYVRLSKCNQSSSGESGHVIQQYMKLYFIDLADFAISCEILMVELVMNTLDLITRLKLLY